LTGGPCLQYGVWSFWLAGQTQKINITAGPQKMAKKNFGRVLFMLSKKQVNMMCFLSFVHLLGGAFLKGAQKIFTGTHAALGPQFGHIWFVYVMKLNIGPDNCVRCR
jgi:hypothetical protein